jgi:intracellular multiplication protein IcmE
MAMTNNMDEFDQDQFDEGQDGFQPAEQKKSFMEALRSKPMFKLLLIMLGVVGAVIVVMTSLSGEKEPPTSRLAQPPAIKEAPGGAATPFFIEQNTQANDQRATEALRQGGSALPTPHGHDVTELLDKTKKDPLTEFREETERLKKELRSEQQQNSQKINMLQQQVVQNQRQFQEDDSLAQAMQKQLQQLMESWNPRGGKVVAGYATEDVPVEEDFESSADLMAGLDPQQQVENVVYQDQNEKTILVHSGTVNYAQLLMEANSDVPGPILAQILSGPLAGGRALGRFEVKNDYLVMTFNLVSFKGKEYSINALALDPDTTLGGMATEVDHRYLSRVLLPAAASFVSAFGKALSETDTTTTVSDGSVLQDKAAKGSEEALYSGLGEAGDTLADFFRDQANQIKPLVRVAVGTPMGIFFLSPVMKTGQTTQNQVVEGLNAQQGTAAVNASAGPYQTGAAGDPQSQMMQNLMRMMQNSPGAQGQLR